jgi:uncharacterized protein YciI
MFIVLLRFSANKARARELMDGHNAWLRRGFDDGVFLLAGSLLPSQGGGILAHATSRSELESRIGADPFVAEDVVQAEIHEIAPARTDERLGFLAG